MAVTVGESARRSELAKQLHRELHPDGSGRPKFGGNQGGGRPRQKRATERVAERIAEEGDLMADAIIDCLKTVEMPHIRLQAARLAADIEMKEADLKAKEDRAFDGMPDVDIVEFLVGGALRGLVTGSIVPRSDDIQQ